jgi:hypothetical protein
MARTGHQLRYLQCGAIVKNLFIGVIEESQNVIQSKKCTLHDTESPFR